MTPNERAMRMREIAWLRELQHRKAAAHAATCVKQRDAAEDNERAQRDTVTMLSREWSQALSAPTLDPSRVGAWAVMTRRATAEAERLGTVARTAGATATAAVDAFVAAHTVAAHAEADAAEADAEALRHGETKRDTMLVELRLARRSFS
jgi:hypothetical protein